jgi:hypothetical protein
LHLLPTRGTHGIIPEWGGLSQGLAAVRNSFWRVTALGQKPTFAPQKVMSALPPKATLNAFSVDPIRPIGNQAAAGDEVVCTIDGG